MAQKYEWTSERFARAAQLVAEDQLSDEAIASELGCHRSTLFRAKQQPEFKAEVEKITAAFAAAILDDGIIDLQARLRAMVDDFERTDQVIAARAATYAEDEEAQSLGGATGIVAGEPVLVKVYETPDPMFDDDGTEIEEARNDQVVSTRQTQVMRKFGVDAPLMRLRLDLLKEIDQQTGNRRQKNEVTGPDEGPIEINGALSGLSHSDLAELAGTVFGERSPSVDPGGVLQETEADDSSD